jgi:hypothetical protein
MKNFLGQQRGRCFNHFEEEILAELLLFLPSFGQSCLYHFEQVPRIEWFIQKIHGASVESFLSNLNMIVGRYKDYRQIWTLKPDTTLQLDAIQSWHPNVGYHAGRGSKRPRPQELFRGREHCRLISGRLYEAR